MEAREKRKLMPSYSIGTLLVTNEEAHKRYLAPLEDQLENSFFKDCFPFLINELKKDLEYNSESGETHNENAMEIACKTITLIEELNTTPNNINAINDWEMACKDIIDNFDVLTCIQKHTLEKISVTIKEKINHPDPIIRLKIAIYAFSSNPLNKVKENFAPFEQSLKNLLEVLNADMTKKKCRIENKSKNKTPNYHSAYISTAGQIAEHTLMMLKSIQEPTNSTQQKLFDLTAYEKKCKKLPLKSHFLKILSILCFGVIGFVLGAAVGLGIGVAAGAITGPGALITGAFGAVGGATAGAVAGVLAAGAGTGLIAAVGSGLLLFKKTPTGLSKVACQTAEVGKQYVTPSKSK